MNDLNTILEKEKISELKHKLKEIIRTIAWKIEKREILRKYIDKL